MPTTPTLSGWLAGIVSLPLSEVASLREDRGFAIIRREDGVREVAVTAEIDEAMIVIDDPQASRASARLNIEGVQMAAGPLTQQIISGVDQLKSLSRALPSQSGASAAATNATTLITMPPQSVEFLLDQGVVSHKTIFFDMDGAQLVTSGQVGLGIEDAVEERIDIWSSAVFTASQ